MSLQDCEKLYDYNQQRPLRLKLNCLGNNFYILKPNVDPMLNFPALTWDDFEVSLIDCMIFQSSFLDVTRMSMSKVSFLAQLDSGILCLYNTFLWPVI